MTLQELRAEIATILADELGTYTYSGGLTTPALRVDDGLSPPVEEPNVTGLEVVLQPHQDMSLRPMLAGDKRFDESIFIVLKSWDVNNTTKAARELLIKELEIDRIEPLQPRNNVLDVIEVSVLVIDNGVYWFG